MDTASGGGERRGEGTPVGAQVDWIPEDLDTHMVGAGRNQLVKLPEAVFDSAAWRKLWKLATSPAGGADTVTGVP
jgi:hypothetical protein